MVTLALHTLVVSLHSTDGTIQWVTTGYLLAMAVAIPVTGWAESRWGGKRVWMAALVLFVVGSVLCALSWNDASLIGFRVLQGFAAGLIFPLMQTLGVRAAGGRASSNLIATVSLPLALGPILGPVIGGVILNWLSWRWLFLVNVPVIAVGLVLAWRLLPADRPDSRRRAGAPGRDRARPARAGAGRDPARPVEPLRRRRDRPRRRARPAAGRDRAARRVHRLGAARPATVSRSSTSGCCGCGRSAPPPPVLFTAGAAMYAGMFLLPALLPAAARRDACCTPGCCSSPRASARWPPASWSASSSPGSAPAWSRSPASCSPPPRPCRSRSPARTPACGCSAPSLLIRGFGIGAVLIPPMSVAYQDVPPAGIPHATMNTRIAQQVGASFGIAIVAVALQSLLAHGATSAFRGAFWWATGITVAALIPALALPAARAAPAADMQPLPAADGFRPGSQLSENTAVGKIPDHRGNRPARADPPPRRRAGERDPRRRVGAADRRGLRALHRRHRRRPRPDQQARALSPLEDPRRPAARHRPPPRRRRSAAVPDTGTLRGDLLALLTLANTTRNPMAALVSSMLGSYYNQTGPTPAELRDAFLSQRGSAVEQVVNRAVERGEIDPARLTPRIIDLPFDLFRNEMMMTLKPVPDHVLRQIVDDIFIPLVTAPPPAR